ncbi:MAG: hypothetical protein JXC32_01145 [Anaerolineae bacterium]|nr:hypothetical protein [Anaerolineae bacterium]
MDLFEVYPDLAEHGNSALKERTLRLINLTGFVYDDHSFYFELGESRFWGRTPAGDVSIGVGTPKVRPDSKSRPHEAVVRHLRKQWRCHTSLFAPGHSYVLEENGQVHVLREVTAHTPYFLLMTAPRLGGADVPDALVQAVYLLPLTGGHIGNASVSILRIAREGLTEFLTPESWNLPALQAQPWATLTQNGWPLPERAQLRPVLAVRGLRAIQQECGSIFFD